MISPERDAPGSLIGGRFRRSPWAMASSGEDAAAAGATERELRAARRGAAGDPERSDPLEEPEGDPPSPPSGQRSARVEQLLGGHSRVFADIQEAMARSADGRSGGDVEGGDEDVAPRQQARPYRVSRPAGAPPPRGGRSLLPGRREIFSPPRIRTPPGSGWVPGAAGGRQVGGVEDEPACGAEWASPPTAMSLFPSLSRPMTDTTVVTPASAPLVA